MLKCGGNQLNAELKGRWDVGQISGLLKPHHVPSSDLILGFNYGNSVYLLWLPSFTLLLASDSLSGWLVLTLSLTVSLSLLLQPSATQHPTPAPPNTHAPSSQSAVNLIIEPSGAPFLGFACRCCADVFSRFILILPSFLHALSLCSNLSMHRCLE